MEVYSQATVKYNPQDYIEHMEFLRKSHGEALMEEERRHRFLAEKHCGLIQSIARLMNKVCSSPQMAFVNSIFYGLLWLIDCVRQMGRFVLQLMAVNVRRTITGRRSNRGFTIMCKHHARRYKSLWGDSSPS